MREKERIEFLQFFLVFAKLFCFFVPKRIRINFIGERKIRLCKNSSLTAKVNEAIATLSASEKEAMMDAAIARQPSEEN